MKVYDTVIVAMIVAIGLFAGCVLVVFAAAVTR